MSPGGSVPPGGRPLIVPVKQKRRHPVRNTLIVLLVLVVAVIGWLAFVPLHAWNGVKRVADAPSGSRPAQQPGQLFLLVGSDSREGLTKEEEKKLGTGNVAGQRTDTIMLLSVPATGKPALISIPRDSYVPIPGRSKNKINAAYSFGGPKLLVSTVEGATGLRIDGYMEIGFAGFVDIVDAVGGVRMCLPAAIKDKDAHINLPKGCQTLNGTKALGYVRMRKADPRGDLGRVERQRAVVAAVVKKAGSAGTILNPVQYWALTHAGVGAITVGEEMSLAQTARLGNGLRAISGGNGLTLTVPVSNPGASTPVGSAVIWDEAKARAMFALIAKGDTTDLAKYAK